MSAAAAIELANEIVAAINAAAISGVNAQRVYFIDHDLRALAEPKTSVVVSAIRSPRSSRGSNARGIRQTEIDIDIGYQSRTDSNAESDALMAKNDLIVAAVETDLGDFSYLQSERKFLNDAEGIKDRKVFTAVTTFTFQFY